MMKRFKPNGSQIGGRILHLVLMLGNCQCVARIEPLLRHSSVVDLRAVAAIHIFDKPVTAVDGECAMMGRDIGKPQTDVAALATPDEQLLLEQRNRIAAAEGNHQAKDRMATLPVARRASIIIMQGRKSHYFSIDSRGQRVNETRFL